MKSSQRFLDHRYLVILILYLWSTKVYAQKTEKHKYLPGVVKVTDSLYYDATEITNFSWLEYLYWVRINETSNYSSVLPDTNAWLRNGMHMEAFTAFYLRHPKYRDYPVVGVSWEQAKLYCAWRTERVKHFLEINNRLGKVPDFTYRLPTYKEFKLMYNQVENWSEKAGDERKKKYQGSYQFNLARKDDYPLSVPGIEMDSANVTAPVFSYWPNDYGVYNIKGNVSEWLSSPNTHAGGSWYEAFSEDNAVLRTAQQPAAFIGFRCVCELLGD